MTFSLRLEHQMVCMLCAQSVCSTEADDERRMARFDRRLGAQPRVCPSCGRALPVSMSQGDRTRLRLWARDHVK